MTTCTFLSIRNVLILEMAVIFMCMLKCGTVVQQVDRWTCDQQVVGSNTAWGKSCIRTWASSSHLCTSVTKQYNLVPAKGR